MKHTYKLFIKYCLSTTISMTTVRNFEVITDDINVAGVGTSGHYGNK
jgi:hypothetical protein